MKDFNVIKRDDQLSMEDGDIIEVVRDGESIGHVTMTPRGLCLTVSVERYPGMGTLRRSVVDPLGTVWPNDIEDGENFQEFAPPISEKIHGEIAGELVEDPSAMMMRLLGQ